jgi:hypothetical protein
MNKMIEEMNKKMGGGVSTSSNQPTKIETGKVVSDNKNMNAIPESKYLAFIYRKNRF